MKQIYMEVTMQLIYQNDIDECQKLINECRIKSIGDIRYYIC